MRFFLRRLGISVFLMLVLVMSVWLRRADVLALLGSDWPKLMEQTAGKPDPQVPSLVTEQLERPEQLKQLSPSTKGQSEEETYEESIQEEKEIVDDAGDAGDAGDVDDTPAQPEQPSSPPSELLSDTWDHMRGGPQEYPPHDRPYMRLQGFEACNCLENATFFTDITLLFNGIQSELNVITAPLLVQHIDSTALTIAQTPGFNEPGLQRASRITYNTTIDAMMRGICFSVAFGSLNEWKPFVEPSFIEREGFHGGRLLRTVDSDVALPFLNYEGKDAALPSFNHKENESMSETPHYNIVYLLFVHDHIENVALLIEAINDPSVFIYVHIDCAAAPEFRLEIERLTHQTNMAIMPTSFAITWGHISLVWSELRAIFDLLDMPIDFDYMINLSGADYPVKTATTMYKALERRPAGNWVWYFDKEWDSEWRYGNMFHCQGPWLYDAPGRCVFQMEPKLGYREWRGIAQLFPHRYKSSQWKILHRNTIEWIRSSEAVKLLLMWAEHTWCPDEELFATILAASPFINRTYPDPKRLVWWRGGPHPHDWNMGDLELIEEWESHVFFIRKVWLATDPSLKELLDGIRERDQVSDELVTHFRDGIIPVD